ncbi:MAG: FG-GAP-like repeat-containing protein, partial [Bacteroidota bacterium]
DGSQDIGHEFGFLSPGAGSEEGTALDFWFSGNTAPVYKNEFSPTTNPNSLSNSLANSLISIRNFGIRDSVMKFVVQIGDERISPLDGYPKFVGKSAGNYSPQVIQDKVFVSVNDSVFAYTLDGSSATPLSAGLFSAVGGQFPIAFVRQDGSDDIFAGVQDSSIIVWTASDLDTDGKYDVISTASIMTSGRISTSPAIHPSDFTLFVGDENGNVTLLRIDSVTAVQKISSERITSLALNTEIVNPLLSVVAITERELIPMAGDSIQLPFSSGQWEVVFGLLPDGMPFFVVSDRGGERVQVYDGSLSILFSRDFASGANGLSSAALGDIDGDGLRDIVFASGNSLYAFTPYGTVLDYFPVRVHGNITSDPVIADLNGDRNPEIIFSTDEKQLVAIDRMGRTLSEFPLVLDGINRFTPAAFASLMANTSVPGIVAVTGNGYVSGWQLKEVPGSIALPWASYRGNARHTAFENSQLLGDPITTAFFPEQRAYNWPNPVYEDRTNIRYYVSKDAVVRIKVFDLAGDLVDEFSGPGVGGFDNEVPWDVSNLQSGIYFARIEASSGAENGVAIIKIAVVK